MEPNTSAAGARLSGEPGSQEARESGEPQDEKRDMPLEQAESRGPTEYNDPADNMVLGPFANGYHFPPSRSTGEAWKRGSLAFAKYCMTPFGFLVVLYGLLVVGWGGMIFLLLCNAAPAMCHPTCNDINSPRRIWIEIDSQVLNALFCVTGFGLAPWRFRDLYYLLQYRIMGQSLALRRLAGIHRGWFRLAGSDSLPVELGPKNIEEGSQQSRDNVPYPEDKIADAPLTGTRAPPTAMWKLDFVVWTNVWNTFFQCCLSGFMWGMNRYDRPSFAVGLFVGLAMVVAAMGGLMIFFEGKHVKSIEGVPVTEEDLERLARDKELGITHYNNIKDKKPKVSKKSKKSKQDGRT